MRPLSRNAATHLFIALKYIYTCIKTAQDVSTKLIFIFSWLNYVVM